MAYNFEKIISEFNVNGTLISCERYGEGHINETYLAVLEQEKKPVNYILQKINSNLFKDVDKLMNNIKLVTEFNRSKIKERGGNPDRESLSLVYAKDGKPYIQTEDGYFRLYIFITDAIAYQTVDKPELFYQSAVAFGNFANLLAEFDATKLYEVLPNFHNTIKRFENFEKALSADAMGRASSVKEEIDFFLERKDYCGKIVNLLNSGEMPTKVTHNDTKINNILFDQKTGAPAAVIDLDTVMPGSYLYDFGDAIRSGATGTPVDVIDLDTIMPGSICYDFGDSIRFGCNTGAEDEPDLTKVNFSIELFEAYAKGYLTALGDSVTKIERENLPWGAILMTLECGMRFLTDYLEGDHYFRTHREGHNLDRTRTQIKLVTEMEKNLSKMQEIIEKY